jgi:DNA-binding beta-propeller fold protein YncE
MSTQVPDSTALVVVPLEEEEKRRRWLLLLLMLLLVLLACVVMLFMRYLWRPAPLPDLLPLPVNLNYPPHYLFSIYGVDKPVGIALSPSNDRIYVTETGGERLIKIFNLDGDLLGSFAPPRTRPGHRSPVYVATDKIGRVYVTDRLQHAVMVYDRNGVYLDTILGPNLTLGEHVSKQVGGLQKGDIFAFNSFEPNVYYQRAGQEVQILPVPDKAAWSPLGINLDKAGNMLLTDVFGERHIVRQIPGDVILTVAPWQDFDPPKSTFGAYGQGKGQFLFPNAAIADSRGWVYVSDGNNGRISLWDEQGRFVLHFGQGTGDGSLSLPRGLTIDARDRLYVVDAVGQTVQVYAVSKTAPGFLFAFGDWGLGDGQFNYPNDITLDDSGRLYVTDRENDRIQVWSY